MWQLITFVEYGLLAKHDEKNEENIIVSNQKFTQTFQVNFTYFLFGFFSPSFVERLFTYNICKICDDSIQVYTGK